jgi:hypothetical protein
MRPLGRIAVDLMPEAKAFARGDEDLPALRTEPGFIEPIGE